MKLVDHLLDKVAAPILVTILTPAAVALASRVFTGDWLTGLNRISVGTRVLFAVGMLAWVAVVLVRRRLRQLEGGQFYVGCARLPLFGWVDLGTLHYAGVLWRIRAPGDSLLHFEPERVVPDDIDVVTPPRCPDCETEIEEQPRFWGGWTWRCCGCGFSKKSRNSYHSEASRVGKVGRREWERKLGRMEHA